MSRGGDAAAAPRLPFVEERLEQLVEEPAALERRARRLVFGLLGHLQHVRHVELERALHVALEPADADARQHPRAGLALESPADRAARWPRATAAHGDPARSGSCGEHFVAEDAARRSSGDARVSVGRPNDGRSSMNDDGSTTASDSSEKVETRVR